MLNRHVKKMIVDKHALMIWLTSLLTQSTNYGSSIFCLGYPTTQDCETYLGDDVVAGIVRGQGPRDFCSDDGRPWRRLIVHFITTSRLWEGPGGDGDARWPLLTLPFLSFLPRALVHYDEYVDDGLSDR
jgi:hypothetical protein